MVPQDLQNKIAQGEGYFTEFKRNVNGDLKQEVEKAGLPEPIFHYNYFFAVEFTRMEKVEKSSEKYRVEGLNEGLKSVLSIIIKNPGIQAKQISEILNRPIKTLERQIKILSEKSLIERKGSKKTGGYWTQ